MKNKTLGLVLALGLVGGAIFLIRKRQVAMSPLAAQVGAPAIGNHSTTPLDNFLPVALPELDALQNEDMTNVVAITPPLVGQAPPERVALAPRVDTVLPLNESFKRGESLNTIKRDLR